MDTHTSDQVHTSPLKSGVSVFLFAAGLLAASHCVMAAVAVPDSSEVESIQNSAETAQPATSAANTSIKVLPASSRGHMLYENHCTTCHESTVYIRDRHKARDLAELSTWVRQRADWLKLGWSHHEIQDVTEYLNARYYKYPVAE